MSGSIELARQTLQRLANDSSDFVALASASYELGLVIRYGDVRQFDADPLKPPDIPRGYRCCVLPQM